MLSVIHCNFRFCRFFDSRLVLCCLAVAISLNVLIAAFIANNNKLLVSSSQILSSQYQILFE